MGNIIFRILHILLLVVGVVLVTSMTDANVREKQVIAYSHNAYEQDDLTFMIDGNYLNEIPIVFESVTQNGRSYNVYIYDVAYAITIDETTTFSDGLQIIIEQVAGEDLPYATATTFSGDNDFELSYSSIQYYDLPLYVMYDQDNGKLRLNRDELGNNVITNINVTDNTQTYISLDVTIDINDLVAKGWIEDYMSTHDVLNVDDIPNLTTIEFLDVNTVPIIIRNLVIYVVVASALSAGVIFYRRRHLGRGKVNPRLREDIERLNEQNAMNPREELK